MPEGRPVEYEHWKHREKGHEVGITSLHDHYKWTGWLVEFDRFDTLASGSETLARFLEDYEYILPEKRRP